MKRNLNFIFDDAYYEGDKRKINNGIYCQTIDRWILVDNYDFWITLQTAKLLSSKIATTVYVLPNNINGMDDTNCLNYMIFNKTAKKIGKGAELIRNQIPMLKQIIDPNQISFVGIPEDFKNQQGIDTLTTLKEFVDYLNKCTYAIEMCMNVTNYLDNKIFSENYIPKELLIDVSSYADTSTHQEGLFRLIRKALYMSNDIIHARESVNEVWRKNIRVKWMRNIFYKIIGENYIILTEEDQANEIHNNEDDIVI